MGFRALRGGRLLNDDEYKSYLALATRLNNIGVLLGAGASVSAGGRLMRQVWQDFCNSNPDSERWLRDNEFLIGDPPHIESLLNQIYIAEAEWSRQRKHKDLKELCYHRDQLYRALVKAALLDDSLWKAVNVDDNSDPLFLHRKLLSRLLATREPGQTAPWVFTTNYDLAVEWAAESLGIPVINGFSGLHNRIFTPQHFDLAFRNARTRSPAQLGVHHVYLVKLHGSLSWVLDSQGVREESVQALRSKLESFLHADKHGQWPGLMIFPSAAKYLDTTGYVFSELFRRLAEFLSEPGTCLIVNGYSFGDDHINRLLLGFLQNPTAQLILYVPDADVGQDKRLILRSNNSRWLQWIVQEEHPQVTVVFGGSNAYFDALIRDLPEPAIMDDLTIQARKFITIIGELAQGVRRDHESNERDGFDYGSNETDDIPFQVFEEGPWEVPF